MIKQLYSNGKLLLTGEYAILDGAKGLALPTRFGQFLNLSRTGSDTLDWASLDENNNPWFSAQFSRKDLRTISTSDVEISNRLVEILLVAKQLNPNFLSRTIDFNSIETKLTFPRNWGLGSSSTLVANIAQWAAVNPYRLLEATFGGSGYDIACARHNKPIIYQNSPHKPLVSEVDFKPRFSEHLFFVYLNQKKNSRDAIKAYRNLRFDKDDLVSKINVITDRIVDCNDLQEFEQLLLTHENIISNTLHIPTIKETHFADYQGSLKSLGAWGGDFILATGTTQARKYFKKMGYTTILSFAEMIK